MNNILFLDGGWTTKRAADGNKSHVWEFNFEVIITTFFDQRISNVANVIIISNFEDKLL